MSFSLGVNYWPRRTATAMWQRFDAGEIRPDFAHIAALGLDTVRFFLRWDDFQPRADRVADGRLGAYRWRWADYLVRSDGSEKPVAAALAAFARQARTVVKPNDMPMIARAYYFRTLPASTRTLYEAFLRFVDERRADTGRAQ
jgi:hypothetical protein